MTFSLYMTSDLGRANLPDFWSSIVIIQAPTPRKRFCYSNYSSRLSVVALSPTGRSHILVKLATTYTHGPQTASRDFKWDCPQFSADPYGFKKTCLE